MDELQILILSAAFLGFIHTLLGPDHYLPFIVLSKARKWSQSKTLWITFISGVGHIGGSVILGIVGVALGISLTKLEAIEAQRGSIVGWLLVIFGLLYTLYGIKKYIKNGGHFHLPKYMIPKKIRGLRHFATHAPEKIYENTYEHSHEHSHVNHHEHDHEQKVKKTHKHTHAHTQEDITNVTPWILFLIFVFGPCEVLIPLLIYPAAEHNTFGIIAVSTVFGIGTLATMLTIVYLGYKGSSLIKVKNGEKYFHLIAGLVILMSGLGMQFLGW
ncbi:MAG: sulfite exporter TauE/SafE family protein [Salinivirgaceae bacterium]|jgi:nickel/cobalt exporter|nr:sulfite exporter TauE/SafE family protein [Salinivirgaceae bacterium]